MAYKHPVARLDDALVLAGLLRLSWPQISDGIPAWHPCCEGEDEGEDENQDAGDNDDSGESREPLPRRTNADDDRDEPDSEAERLGRLEAENQRLKREAAARERDRRKAESETKKAEDERKAQAGEWEKLANERAEKIGELEQQITDRDRKDAEREQRTTAEKVAERLNFRRPRRAYALLADELGDGIADTLADEQLTEAALKRIARAEPELVDNTRRSGAPVNGRGQRGSDPAREHNELIAGLLGGVAPNQ